MNKASDLEQEITKIEAKLASIDKKRKKLLSELSQLRQQVLQTPGTEDLYDVINERFEKGNILLTSNRAPAERPDLFLNPLLASASLDRLID